MASYSPTPTPPPDLRERRRLELTRTIALAAVELFERKGFSATSIDDIAASAGISRTTFFRHCATKEAAVLVDDAGMEAELLGAAARASDEDPLRDLERFWVTMAEAFDSDTDGHDRFLRVRRLMRDNPPLLAAGLERDARLTGHVAAALRDQAGLGALDAHAVAESFALGMRLTFDEWVRHADEKPGSPPPPLGEVYQRVLTALRRANRVAQR